MLDWEPFPPAGDLEPMSLASPALAGGFFITATWEFHGSVYMLMLLSPFVPCASIPSQQIGCFLNARYTYFGEKCVFKKAQFDCRLIHFFP